MKNKYCKTYSNFVSSQIELIETTTSTSWVDYKYNVIKTGIIILNASTRTDQINDTGSSTIIIKVNDIVVAESTHRLSKAEATEIGASASFSGIANEGDVITVQFYTGKTGTKTMYINGVCLFGCGVELETT